MPYVGWKPIETLDKTLELPIKVFGIDELTSWCYGKDKYAMVLYDPNPYTRNLNPQPLPFSVYQLASVLGAEITNQDIIAKAEDMARDHAYRRFKRDYYSYRKVMEELRAVRKAAKENFPVIELISTS